MQTLRIALAQVNPCVGDIAGNTALVLTACRAADGAGARLVLLPEMVITGYPIEDLALRESFQRGAAKAVTSLASKLAAEGLGHLTVVLGSLGTSPDGRPTNRAHVLTGGAIVAQYDKHHLPNYGVFDERRIFSPGDSPCVIEVDGVRVGVVICEDIWQDGGPVTEMAAHDVQLLAVLNGSPFEEGKGRVRTELARRRAAEVGAPLAYVNMWGGQDDLVFDGHSFIIGADGAWLANAPGFEDALLVWDVPADGDAPRRSGCGRYRSRSPAPAPRPAVPDRRSTGHGRAGNICATRHRRAGSAGTSDPSPAPGCRRLRRRCAPPSAQCSR